MKKFKQEKRKIFIDEGIEDAGYQESDSAVKLNGLKIIGS